LRVNYAHYDMKIRKKEHGFPKSLHEIVKPFVKKTGIFCCNRRRMQDYMSQIEV